MRKLITTTLLAVLLGVSGLSLSACDQGNNGDRNAPGAAPSNPGTAPSNPGQNAPGGDTPDGGGMGS